MNMNIYQLFSNAAQRGPTHPALLAGVGNRRRSVSFEELDRRVGSVVGTLRKRGLRAGDKVLLAVPISIDTYVVMLALLKAGMVIMHIDPAHGSAKVAQILKAWPPAAIVASRPILMLGILFPELRRIPKRFVVGGRARGATALLDARENQVSQAVIARSPADSAILSFTSGSTGEPKALIRTHGFLLQQMEILKRVATLEPNDVDFVAMPMFVLFNLAHGITSVLPACNMKHPGRADPRIILSQLLAESATRVVASPALLERLADHCLIRKRTIPDMRCISTGGGPVGPTLPMRLRTIAPNALVRTVYGSTEAEPIASIDAHEVSLADRSATREGAGLLVGKPVRGCAVRIIRSEPDCAIGPLTDEAFSNLCLAVGRTGEIVVSGEHVISGYADPARDRGSKIRVQNTVWHRTGDAGYFDSAGRLWLAGRSEAALSDYRGTVYPFQVEYAVSAVRGVRRAALIEKDGDRVLVLETSGGEFRNHCAEAAKCVARFDIDRIVTMHRIPVDRRHDAKVDYPALARLLAGRWRRYRDLMVEFISFAFTTFRDGCNRLLTQTQIRLQHKH